MAAHCFTPAHGSKATVPRVIRFASLLLAGALAMPAEEWPTRAGVSGRVAVEVVEESFGDGRFLYQSEHFRYQADGRLSRNLVSDMAEVFEGTYAALEALPLPLRLAPAKGRTFDTLLFGDYASFIRAGGMPGSAGTYAGARGIMLVPAQSLGLTPTSTGFRPGGATDYAILVHEITHQVMHPMLHYLPVWFSEGIAEVMERQPYDRGRIHFRRFDLRRHLRDTLPHGDTLAILPPDRLYSLSNAAWNAGFGSSPAGLRNQYFSAFLHAWYWLRLADDGDGATIHRWLAALTAGEPPVEATANLLLPDRDGLSLRTRMERALSGSETGRRLIWLD
ncbi:MAG: hypothetical protein ACFE0O_03475 [Opitutales bacterium]